MIKDYKVIAVEEDRSMLLMEDRHVLRDKDDLSYLKLETNNIHFSDNDLKIETRNSLLFKYDIEIDLEHLEEINRLEDHMEIKISQSCPLYKGTLKLIMRNRNVH